jgi:hypothetical protein
MISGPKVDVYVGPKKKHYNLPKLLLCHYSKYFDRCFNGPFVEGQTQKLELPEDNVEYFEFLLEYMLRGKFPDTPPVACCDGFTTYRWLEFLQYADKYDFGDVSGVVFERLKKRLSWLASSGRLKGYHEVDAQCIEVVFTAAPAGSLLRALIVQAALSDKGVDGLKVFAKQEERLEGYAAELLKQIRSSRISGGKWTDPLTKKIRTD